MPPDLQTNPLNPLGCFRQTREEGRRTQRVISVGSNKDFISVLDVFLLPFIERVLSDVHFSSSFYYLFSFSLQTETYSNEYE